MTNELSREARTAEAKQYHQKAERKKTAKQSPVWFEFVGTKVVEKTKNEAGTVYSRYVGKAKDFAHLVTGKK